MKNNATQMMYQNAFMNLSNGVINPIDREVLAYTPLPDSVIAPYVKQGVDALQTMNMTNSALNAWVEESQKASYFTKHFVTLSRMIMNGVASMARGLVTLHMRGENLEQAPLSIQDLLNISSYQFRKSYLGVLQTVKSHPEISERLLLNQIGWNNTLLKLFKTKEKLAREIRIQKPEIRKIESSEGHEDNPAAALPAYQDGDALLSSSSEPGLAESSALSEQSAYAAFCAFSSFDKGGNRRVGKSISGSSLPTVSVDPEVDHQNHEIPGNVLADPVCSDAAHETQKIPEKSPDESGDSQNGQLPSEKTAGLSDKAEDEIETSEFDKLQNSEALSAESSRVNESSEADPIEAGKMAAAASGYDRIDFNMEYHPENWIYQPIPIPVRGRAPNCPDTS